MVLRRTAAGIEDTGVVLETPVAEEHPVDAEDILRHVKWAVAVAQEFHENAVRPGRSFVVWTKLREAEALAEQLVLEAG